MSLSRKKKPTKNKFIYFFLFINKLSLSFWQWKATLFLEKIILNRQFSMTCYFSSTSSHHTWKLDFTPSAVVAFPIFFCIYIIHLGIISRSASIRIVELRIYYNIKEWIIFLKINKHVRWYVTTNGFKSLHFYRLKKVPFFVLVVFCPCPMTVLFNMRFQYRYLAWCNSLDVII